MTFLVRGLTLGLAWYLVVSLGVSLALAFGVSRLTAPAGRLARLGTTRLFALRVLPSLAAAAFVCCVFVPSYVVFEPRTPDESVGVSLVALAAVMVACVARGVWRAGRGLRDARSASSEWLTRARSVGAAELSAGLPMFAVETPAPVVALVGVWRPRLFVAREVLRRLSPRELAATIAHEVCHRRAHDNLKRVCVRLMPDLLGVLPAGRAIERAWTRAAEHEADANAVAALGVSPLELASAIIKVARLSQALPVPLPVSRLDDGDDLDDRVRRLIEGRTSQRARLSGLGRVWLVLGAATAVAALVAISASVPGVHELSEALLVVLP
ncbi:MAG: M56 family metallopeptidase [Vicinamibacterales bacterium]